MGFDLLDSDVWTIIFKNTTCKLVTIIDADTDNIFQVARHGDLAGAFGVNKQLRLALKAALCSLSRREFDTWIASNVCVLSD